MTEITLLVVPEAIDKEHSAPFDGFVYMALVLGVAFSSAATSPLFAASPLLTYGVGHCSAIFAIGSAIDTVQRYLDWNERSHAALRFRQICGLLVMGANLYLMLAALSACIIKGIERVASVLKFDLRGVDVRVDGVRQDEPLMQAQCRK